MRSVWVLLTCMILSGCQTDPALPVQESLSKQTYLTIATGGRPGPYYQIGDALAKAYGKKLGYNVTVQSTDGTVQNIQLIMQDKADMAFAMSDTVAFAYQGRGTFHTEGPFRELRAMAGLYSNFVQVVTLDERRVSSIADLKGKKVGVGAPGSGVEANARMVLEGYGISYRDIEPHYLSYSEAMEQLRKGAIDAAFVTSGLPNPSVVDLMESDTLYIVPIREEDAKRLQARFPFFKREEIPKGTYGNEHPIPTVAIPNIMLVREDLPADQVYKLTEKFFESIELLGMTHHAAQQIDIRSAWTDLPIPYHPGAEKFYREWEKTDAVRE